MSWEEVERCESAPLVFSAATESFKTASRQRGFDTWLWAPCQKVNTKCFPENDLTTLLQYLNSVVLLCYLYKTACGGINVIKMQVATSVEATRRMLSPLAFSLD